MSVSGVGSSSAASAADRASDSRGPDVSSTSKSADAGSSKSTGVGASAGVGATDSFSASDAADKPDATAKSGVQRGVGSLDAAAASISASATAAAPRSVERSAVGGTTAPEAAEVAAEVAAPAPPPPAETVSHPLGELLDQHPEIEVNQDLINHFMDEGRGDWGRAASAAQDVELDLNELTQNRQGAARDWLPDGADTAPPAADNGVSADVGVGTDAAVGTDAVTTTPTSASELSDLLAGIETTGASARTARQDGIRSGGVDASHQMAQTDLQRVQAHRDAFQAAADEHGIPVELVAAIASRETRGGNVLDRNGYGDHGNGFGLMQVDKRYHTLQGTHDPASAAHLSQATGILANEINNMRTMHPDWTPAQHLQGAIAAYNTGPSGLSPNNFDGGTTGRDYSNDVIARAQYYAEHF
jgi:hypothetical protein